MKVERIDFEDGKQLAEAAFKRVLEEARKAIDAKGRFVLGLAGGSTPKVLYQLLATSSQDWSKWFLIYGDERCLTDGDPERNSTMLEESWLQAVNFPQANHYVPQVDVATDRAAANYSEIIQDILPLDVALLGLGEDGHTASLFPGQEYPEQPVVPVYNSPKPPSERISLSYSTLCKSRSVCYLVAGADKQAAITGLLEGADIPAAKVSGVEKTILMVAKNK